MISTLQSGHYRLIETKHHVKILYLDGKAYAWIEPANMGEILVASHNPHKTDCLLCVGRYRIFKVDDEPYLADHIHLELQVGRHTWQGYLLLTGLPDDLRPRVRIIPTPELVRRRRPTEQQRRVAFSNP